jgi:hypothetical protein
MSVPAVEVVEIGYSVWKMFLPWRRLKVWRNKIRARHGKPPLPNSENDMKLFPNGTMTYTGAGGAFATQIVTQLLLVGGIGECTPVELAANPNCQGATQIAGALITAGFAIVALIGRYRAQRSHAAQLAALAATVAVQPAPTQPGAP